MSRLSRYHVLMATYCASGLSLCLAFAVSIRERGGSLCFEMWHTGAQLAVPILLFWTVAGIRVAFLLPDELSARWIFRMAPLVTRRVVTSCKWFVFLACCACIAAVASALACAHWSGADVALQVAFGICYAILLTDLFFFLEASVPFTRPQLGERASLPLTLAVFVFGVPVFCLLAITLERWAGYSALRLIETLAATLTLHVGMHQLRRLPSHPASSDPFLGETDTEVRTLGLSL